ncbi:conserved hypothetical protein [Culex quinquefasciatus]|uniref:Uncharacterized protein n=1 Tax=Culex quinquefasciatus TaxID=7176 RepID=B0WBY4_CULQU|nr:conserved hypothetical protein [Culex quinquefasciatus]|eukprot:XP_001846218.1 conserved hypothetical protein [Culex quinquefasciatus]
MFPMYSWSRNQKAIPFTTESTEGDISQDQVPGLASPVCGLGREDDVTRRGGMSVGKKRVASRPFGSTVTRMMTRRAVGHFHGTDATHRACCDVFLSFATHRKTGSMFVPLHAVDADALRASPSRPTLSAALFNPSSVRFSMSEGAIVCPLQSRVV